MKKLYSIVSIALLAITLVSCVNLENESKISTDSTVYATAEELQRCIDCGFVDYNVSRYYALSALESFSEENAWQNAKLSQQPVIIYNSKNKTPRYYEFQILVKEKPVGAISCVTDKKEGLPVKYLLPFNSTVTENENRSLNSGQFRICDTGYPSKKRVFIDKSGRIANSDEENLEDLTIENMTDSEFTELGYTEEEKQELLKLAEEESAEIAEIWEKIDGVSENIAKLTEEELLELYEDEDDSSREVIYNTYSVINHFELSKWYNKRNWGLKGFYCGPSCISFILIGLGEDAHNNIVPLSNDAEKILTLYHSVQNRIGTGPKLFSDLSYGLEYFAPYKLKICKPYWETIFDHVKGAELPCISLRGSKGLSKSDIQFHYRVVIGTKTEKVRTRIKIGRIKKTLFSWHDHFYYMQDNGTDGTNFYENSKKLNQIGAAKVVKK